MPFLKQNYLNPVSKANVWQINKVWVHVLGSEKKLVGAIPLVHSKALLMLLCSETASDHLMLARALCAGKAFCIET